MKKTLSIFLSYLLITFNSFVFATENNNKDILKIGVLAPFSGELKFIGETILYSINLALHDIDDNSIKIYPKDSGELGTSENTENTGRVAMISCNFARKQTRKRERNGMLFG